MRRGQTTAEYIFLIGAAAAGLIVMLVYVSRGHQGRLRSEAEQLGARQYAPGNTVIDNRETKTLASTASAGSTTTTEYGNLNEPNEALEYILAAIESTWISIYALRQSWEDLVVTEATAGGIAFRAGDFGWVGTGLTDIEEDLVDANTVLFGENPTDPPTSGLYYDAQIEADIFRDTRTPDKSVTTSYSSETGTVTIHKDISETLGDL